MRISKNVSNVLILCSVGILLGIFLVFILLDIQKFENNRFLLEEFLNEINSTTTYISTVVTAKSPLTPSVEQSILDSLSGLSMWIQELQENSSLATPNMRFLEVEEAIFSLESNFKDIFNDKNILILNEASDGYKNYFLSIGVYDRLTIELVKLSAFETSLNDYLHIEQKKIMEHIGIYITSFIVLAFGVIGMYFLRRESNIYVYNRVAQILKSALPGFNDSLQEKSYDLEKFLQKFLLTMENRTLHFEERAKDFNSFLKGPMELIRSESTSTESRLRYINDMCKDVSLKIERLFTNTREYMISMSILQDSSMKLNHLTQGTQKISGYAEVIVKNFTEIQDLLQHSIATLTDYIGMTQANYEKTNTACDASYSIVNQTQKYSEDILTNLSYLEDISHRFTVLMLNLQTSETKLGKGMLDEMHYLSEHLSKYIKGARSRSEQLRTSMYSLEKTMEDLIDYLRTGSLQTISVKKEIEQHVQGEKMLHSLRYIINTEHETLNTMQYIAEHEKERIDTLMVETHIRSNALALEMEEVHVRMEEMLSGLQESYERVGEVKSNIHSFKKISYIPLEKIKINT